MSTVDLQIGPEPHEENNFRAGTFLVIGFFWRKLTFRNEKVSFSMSWEFLNDMKRNLGVVVDYSVSNDVMTLLHNQKSTEFHVPRLPVSVYNSDACK